MRKPIGFQALPGPEARALRVKTMRLRYFGLRISDFWVFSFNPHSAIAISQFEGDKEILSLGR